MNQYERKLIQTYLRAETDIINEIARLRSLGLADYHAAAALRRVRRILSWMQSEGMKELSPMSLLQLGIHHPKFRRRLKPSIQIALFARTHTDLPPL